MGDVVAEATEDAELDSWKYSCRYAVAQGLSESRDSGDDGPQYFVACFSEDGDRLSQWRGYGKSIGGYALGFPFDHLRAIKERINDSQVGKTCDESSPRIEVDFRPCWYDPKEQQKWLREEFERHLGRLEPIPIEGSTQHDSCVRLLLKAIARAASPYFKDPAFKDEREWRLVVRVSRSKGSTPAGHDRERTQDDSRLDDVATVKYRSGEYSLIPYIVLPVVLKAELTLSEVVFGPTPLPENARAAAMQFLRPKPERSRTPISAPADRKIVCEKIVNSKIPFRRV